MIVRQQFTVWNSYQLPRFYYPEYLEYERVKSGKYEAICTFGYYDTEKKTWIKLADVPKEIKEDL